MRSMNHVPLVERIPSSLRNRAAFALARLGLADRLIDKALYLEGPSAGPINRAEFWDMRGLENVPPAGAVLGANGWEPSPVKRSSFVPEEQPEQPLDGVRGVGSAALHGAADAYGSDDFFAVPWAPPAGAVFTGAPENNGWESVYVPATPALAEREIVLPAGGIIQ